MPWRETCQMDERTQFIARVLAGGDAMTALCREYAISRKTGYKWLGRYRREGAAGLRERSHAPLRHGQAHDVAVLQAAGRSRRRRRCPAYAQPFAAVSAANDVWCTDFKSLPLARTGGWFRTADGRRCDPFTLTDAHSRYLLRCQAVARPDEASVRPIFEVAFKEHRLPRAIRSDNGPAFASPGVGGLSRLAVWWIKLGITPERIVAGKPQQNGRHERVHRTLKEATATPPAESGRTRRWDRRRRHRCTSRRRGPTPTGSTTRATAAMSRSAGCAATARSNGRAS